MARLSCFDNVENASFDEMVEIALKDGRTRMGRSVEIEGKRCVIQVLKELIHFL